jgi:hypothetical protein
MGHRKNNFKIHKKTPKAIGNSQGGFCELNIKD